MSASVILTEKLRRPEAVGLARPRLEAGLLNRSSSRLDLVVAPPGSGKTTLLARVAAAAAATSVPVAWYRVTADDAPEAALAAHLGRALQDALGVPTPDSGIGALLESLEAWTGPGAILVLDDLHEIAGSAAERALEQFVQLRPHALRVLIGSRRQPEMNIPRLRVSGLLHEISSDDLRFRSWEVEELFIAVFREPLSPESAAALTRRTGGWAAGLQLFHLATSGRSAVDRQRAVDDLGGRSKLVRSYLARNVLAELPQDRRQFLLRTCTLGSLTGELCDALLETTGSRKVLDELEQQQLFTSSEDDGETFRYHEVLRTHLEWTLVQEYGTAGARQWYSRSAVVLESIGDQRGAVRAHARAEDWGAVARLLQARESGLHDAGSDLLLPASVVRHDPWLSLAEARRRVREGALGAAVDAFRQAETLLDEPDFRESCRRERTVAAIWGAGRPVGPSWAAESRHWSVQVRAATRRAVIAQAAAAGPSSFDPARRPAAGEQRLGLGLTALIAGEFGTAQDALTSVEHDPVADPAHRLLAQLGGTVIDLLTDGCADPAGRLGQIALDAELAGLPWVARISRGLAEAVLVALGSPAWRVKACIDLLGECERAGDDWGAALLRLAVALAGQIADPTSDADEFADAAARFRRLDAPVLAVWAEALQACVLTREGEAGAAELARRTAGQARALQLGGAQAVTRAALELATAAPSSIGPEPDDDDPAGPVVRSALRLMNGSFRSAESSGSAEPAVRRSASEPAGTASSTPVTTVEAGAVTPGPVRVRCFGGFSVEIQGEPVELGTLRPRARALLRLLALTPDRDVHRERLVDALWPGVDLAIGTRRLQVAVSSVRQLLEHNGLSGVEVLARHGDAYRFAPPQGTTIDVLEFEASLRAAAIAAARGDTVASMAARQVAVSVYAGDVLPEDGPADYVVPERERLRLAAAAAAAALAQDSRALDHPRQAVAAARLSVQLDRFQDLGWELLIDLHTDAGDSSAAALARREHAQAQAELEGAAI